MELFGRSTEEVLDKNDVLYEWRFKKILDFSKSYRSSWHDYTSRKYFHVFAMVIFPDNPQSLVKFFLHLYDYKGQGGPKITFSACLVNQDKFNVPQFNVKWPDACLDLATSMKICEIHLSHPILYSGDNYVFKLRIKLHENETIMPLLSNANISEEDTAERKQPPISFEGIHPTTKYLKELSQDMESLFTSGDMCDMEIRIGGDTLHVHKVILCARSPVFKKMMEHDCLESTSKSITITDCTTTTFVKFLKYLYTGEIEGDTIDIVMSLYSLGDKYDVPVLREACSEMLQSKISSGSVDDVANIICDVLQLAECHGNTKLKDLAANFIVTNFPVVSNKQGWKDLMKSNYELISNILVLVASGLHKQVYKTAQV